MSDKQFASARRASDAQRDSSPANHLEARRPLTVGSAHDPAEAQADELARIALQRMGEAASLIEEPETSRVQRSTAAVGAEWAIGAAGGELDARTEAELGSSLGRGRPLGGAVRRDMEAAFGADFGRVRVHDGSNAHRLSRKMQAEAFTV